ncbi:lipopolysaccharide transport periplasmic protein LptA [Methylophaga sp.]|uniref:lipopolysaccharide transport periplasmic protein LptA n=1 Tax=Methylophaga sp. TaxID=2024840 RepID=UPI00140187A6|nr:lipopolysaccharide transport periplasmic protein LptA [Methylophaga sp.]MTI63377.1 lipopolysaccharide transport periplasmic protein LptA [Methylophaga sp.]
MRLPINLLAIAVLMPAMALALPSDREKPISIEADHAQLDDREGVTQYKGDAILTQGTLRITGDIITFFYDDNKQLTKAVAEGKRATYQQVHNPGENPVKAKALKMEYYADRQKIYLIGDGYVQQNGDEFTGNYIEYDIARNVVSANSKPVTVDGETQKKGRVHIIIQPQNTRKPSKPEEKAVPAQSEDTSAPPESGAGDDKQTESQATETEPKSYPTAMTTSRLNVRTGPGTQYQKLGTFAQSMEVIVLTRQTNWAQVRGTINGEVVIGWVNSRYLQ